MNVLIILKQASLFILLTLMSYLVTPATSISMVSFLQGLILIPWKIMSVSLILLVGSIYIFIQVLITWLSTDVNQTMSMGFLLIPSNLGATEF